MADWKPSLYLQFDAERTRPAADLLSRIAHLQVEHAVDLGCGPGNSTRLLRAAWPLATIVGIDNSPAMLVQAAQALPDCEFIDADIARWRPAQPPDVIYANASLQWLTDHETLFPHLVNQLADNGTLAVQMPDNWQEPSHTLMRQVASEMGLPDRGRQPLLPPAAWYDLLSRQGCEVDIWRTTYFHPLASHQAIVDWLQGTGLRPYLAGLDEQAGSAFLTRYLALLAAHYPLQCNGKVLLRFPRLFIVARKIAA
ncbi:TPA: trans-aconitate 2-methyltransferase [Klebsiella pneumoniae]|uniref:trans-aconitate 2-methyltransferase n=1 Tax=Klebsiella pneumoniae TaxID=573 RepID=UPI000E2C29D9|nr:trans-aconitate 2-methyltransferase [Klebsiella pneumoniae]HDS2595992.1 trans-aconitate 2-methyltransferase [Klebsiella pneumoniae subsp. pneumoniae]MDG3466120.1 trans-aconitate 2-methyltransferase [Klebsiella pneumoniae]MDS0185828.1 trans-aconitate 2-methyltransferase [Klebsiella pneumoniae]MDS1047440.1 trans-aconitate 2-methyltransferase [Klebsiella pneumoniae]MDS1065980.1 trans-aconitate 2-methyltransferase [Klebsiella pneumoniae]